MIYELWISYVHTIVSPGLSKIPDEVMVPSSGGGVGGLMAILPGSCEIRLA